MPHTLETEVPLDIFFVDIETMANKGYFWETRKAFISPEMIISPKRVICWAGKWLGKKKILCHDEREGRLEFLKPLHDALSKCDAVVHYHGIGFDIPHVNREFEEVGLDPLTELVQLDLYRAIRKAYNLPSYKFSYVAEHFGWGEKLKNDGWPLWAGCDAGDESAWRKMRRYNRGDVRPMEPGYHQMLPWFKNHPNTLLRVTSAEPRCPACNSDNLKQMEKDAAKKTYKYRQYRCGNCRNICRESRNNNSNGGARLQ